MKLKRKIETELVNWKDTSYSLLMLGARQVGKTYLLKDFLKLAFPNYAELTLHNNVSLIKAIIGATDQNDLLLRLSAFSNVAIGEGGCFFIDEIQEFYTYLEKHPEIDEYYDLITAMKDITANTGIRFALSGSLLRLNLNKMVNLNPEGSLLLLNMYPLDFEEFLWARGVSATVIAEAKSCIEKKKTVPDFIHDRLLKEYKLYLLVGGMPKAVSEFIDHNSFAYVALAHKTIEDFIRQDITKYAPDGDRIKIESIYELLPRELSSPTKRFILSNIEGHKKNDQEYMNFGWLSDAGVAITCHAVSEPVIPLKAASSLNKVKLFHEDVGLLTYLLMDEDIKRRIYLGELDANFGAIYENAVAEELHAHGFENLYFYFQKGKGEVDFALENEGKLELIEIKSGKDYSRLSALKKLMQIPSYAFHASVYYNGNVKEEDGITYFPIYAIDFLYKKKTIF